MEAIAFVSMINTIRTFQILYKIQNCKKKLHEVADTFPCNLPNRRSSQPVPLSKKLHSLHFVPKASFLKYTLLKLYPALKFKRKSIFHNFLGKSQPKRWENALMNNHTHYDEIFWMKQDTLCFLDPLLKSQAS